MARRRREADSERLARQARAHRRERRQGGGLLAGLELLLRARRQPAKQAAGA